MPVLKIMNERRAAKEREIELLSPEILEDCSPEEKATKFSRQQESWQGNNLYSTYGGKPALLSTSAEKEKQNRKHLA